MSSFEGQVSGWFRSPGMSEAHISGPVRRSDSDQAADLAITALVEQYAPTLYRVAYSVQRNSAEAEDAVQETFLRVLKNKDKLPLIRDARVWLIRITWNVVLDKKRRSKVRPETDDVADLTRVLASAEPLSEATVIASEGYAHLLQMMEALPRKEYEALQLSAIEELSTAEIARVLATTESSVRSRLFRARQTLSKLLSRQERAPMERASSFPGGKR